MGLPKLREELEIMQEYTYRYEEVKRNYQRNRIPIDITNKELLSTPEIITNDIVSVIPAYNDQEGLETTLQSLDRFGLAMIVVVDDGSEPPLKIPFDISTPFKMIRHDKNRGPAAARNTGVSATKSDWIYFTDCGCIHEPDIFISYKKSRVAAGSNVSAIVGPVVATSQGRLGTFYTEEEILNPPYLKTFDALSIIACNALVSRAAMDKVGHFDEKTYGTNFGEDTDLGIRLLSIGRIIWAPYAKIAHDFTESLDVFDARFKRYGKSIRLVQHKYNTGVIVVSGMTVDFLYWYPKFTPPLNVDFIDLAERRFKMQVEGFFS